MSQWQDHRGLAYALTDRLIARCPSLRSHRVDIMQDIETLFWEAEQTFDPEGGSSFSSWACVYVLNATHGFDSILKLYRGYGVRAKHVTIEGNEHCVPPVGGEVVGGLIAKEEQIAAGKLSTASVPQALQEILALAPRMQPTRGSNYLTRAGKMRQCAGAKRSKDLGLKRAAEALGYDGRPDKRAAPAIRKLIEDLDNACIEICSQLR